MEDLSQIRNHIESIHLDALCAEFHLQRGGEVKTVDFKGSYPDLANKEDAVDSIFELKSRNHSVNSPNARHRYTSESCWWSLVPGQIDRYEAIKEANEGLSLYWIFLISETDRPPTLLAQLREGSILSRDVFVVPWNAYKLVDSSPKNNIHLGLSRLRQTYEFAIVSANKGNVYVETGIENKVGKYFR